LCPERIVVHGDICSAGMRLCRRRVGTTAYGGL
jgi:hypothetical protein